MSKHLATVDTIKLLASLGRALGTRVEIRPLGGRPPRPTLDNLASVVEEATVETKQPQRARIRHRKLYPDLTSPRRRLAAAKNAAEVQRILDGIAERRELYHNAPRWEEPTIRRYLPRHLKEVALSEQKARKVS